MFWNVKNSIFIQDNQVGLKLHKCNYIIAHIVVLPCSTPGWSQHTLGSAKCQKKCLLGSSIAMQYQFSVTYTIKGTDKYYLSKNGK